MRGRKVTGLGVAETAGLPNEGTDRVNHVGEGIFAFFLEENRSPCIDCYAAYLAARSWQPA